MVSNQGSNSWPSLLSDSLQCTVELWCAVSVTTYRPSSLLSCLVCMLLQFTPSPSSGCSSAALLPEALTARILQHVPQQLRLQQCALTCKAWASAAALAAVHVELKLQAESQAKPALERWLQQHAGQLESLQLTINLDGHDDEQLSDNDWDTRHELQLPWAQLAKLQRLQLHGFELTLLGEGESLGANSAADARASRSSSGEETHTPALLLLPSLQHLELSKVELVSSSSLLQLAGAPGLTSLKISDMSSSHLQYCSEEHHQWRNKEPAVQQLAAAITGLLQQLPRLAVLELPGMPMSEVAMQQLGCMQGLQEVFLEHVDHMPLCDLQHLPSSITQLHFRGNTFQTGPSTSSIPPQLQQLAGLLRLELYGCAVLPNVLGAFTCLQALKLFCCRLLPAPAELDDDDERFGYETEGTAALLGALAGMTCLQDLELALDGLDTVSTAPQRFAALTASTQLTRLAIYPMDCIPLAKGAAQHMFPAGRQLPLLQELAIAQEVTGSGSARWCLDGTDINGIATCCTGLRELNIAHCVESGVSVCVDSSLPAPLAQYLRARGLLFWMVVLSLSTTTGRPKRCTHCVAPVWTAVSCSCSCCVLYSTLLQLPLSICSPLHSTCYCDIHSGLLVYSGTDLSGLLQLPTSLNCLWIGGEAFGDVAAPVLAQLTQLDSFLSYTPGFTDAGLEQLTNLNVERLCIHCSGFSEAVSPGCFGSIDLTGNSGKVRTLTDCQLTGHALHADAPGCAADPSAAVQHLPDHARLPCLLEEWLEGVSRSLVKHHTM